VYLDDDNQEATVVVPDDQLALAIGKEGMNARLAARLTGWKIDITSDSEFAQQEAKAAFGGDGAEGEDFSGRCAAILSNGKRCPNEALPGSRYCGLPAHQALSGREDTLPAEVPETSAVATAEEAEELEAVGRIEEPAGEAILDADPEAPAPEAQHADPDVVPAGIPLEHERQQAGEPAEGEQS
jgi:N utilization substance protein A